MSNHNSNIIVSTIYVSTIIIVTIILFRSVLHSVGQGFKCMLEAPQAQVSREKKNILHPYRYISNNINNQITLSTVIKSSLSFPRLQMNVESPTGTGKQREKNTLCPYGYTYENFNNQITSS